MPMLAALRPGTTASLTSVGGSGGFRRRLLEMGFLPGTRFRVIRRVDVGGLIEIDLRGCRVTLRLSEASVIDVDPVAQRAPDAPAP